MHAIRVRSENPGGGSRTRLLIWLFATFVILLSCLGPLQRLREDRSELVAAALRDNQNRAALLKQYVERTLDAANIATLHIAERYRTGDPALRAGTPAKPATITGPIAGNRNFLGLGIADANGNLVASTLGAEVAFRNVRNHEAFRVHVAGDTGRLFVSRPGFAPHYRGNIVWLTRRLNEPDGSFAGVVAINIAPEQLIGFDETVVIRRNDVVSVIGLDAVTRARRTGDVFSSGEDLSGGQVMRQQLNAPDGSYLGASTLDGLVRIFSHRRLDGYPLFATYGVLEADVMAPFYRRRLLVLLASALVSGITLAFAITTTSLLRRRERWAAEVERTNARLEEAQRIAQIGDWEYDFATQQASWSPQLFEMYERDPAAGHPTIGEFATMLDTESRTTLDAALRRAIETGEPQSYELKVRLPSGAEGRRLIAAIPVRGPDGKVTGLRGTDQDVTAQRKLDQLEAEVSHLSRLAAMNAMAATLAHELNQPLAAASNYIVGTRRLLAAGDGPSAKATDGMLAAQEQVQFAGEIIRRVRAMVANEPQQMVPAATWRIIDEAVSLALPATSSARVTVTKAITDEARFVRGDRVQIQQVLLNLIRNASEAVAGRPDPRIQITAERANPEQVLISVEDNGTGLKDVGAPLFTAFASDKPNGLGLGLSISRTIVEGHGGRIWAENLSGAGARFSFTVPAGETEDEGA